MTGEELFQAAMCALPAVRAAFADRLDDIVTDPAFGNLFVSDLTVGLRVRGGGCARSGVQIYQDAFHGVCDDFRVPREQRGYMHSELFV